MRALYFSIFAGIVFGVCSCQKGDDRTAPAETAVADESALMKELDRVAREAVMKQVRIEELGREIQSKKSVIEDRQSTLDKLNAEITDLRDKYELVQDQLDRHPLRDAEVSPAAIFIECILKSRLSGLKMQN